MTAATLLPYGDGVVATPPLDQARVHLVWKTEDCFDLLRWASTKTDLAIDTETTGLDHDLDRPRLIQVGDAMDGWAIPVERWAGVVHDLVERFRGRWWMHNAPFDHAMLKNIGINIPTWTIDDTRILAHVHRSVGSLELKELAATHIDSRAKSAQKQLDDILRRRGGFTWETIPIDFRPYWVYGCLDPILTFRLGQYLKPRVMAVAPRSYELEMRIIWIVERMARKGIAVDIPYTQNLINVYADKAEQIRTWTQQTYGINPGSSEQVSAVLQATGVPLSKTTSTGYSTDKEVLSDIDHPLADAVLEYRQSTKLVSTYLQSYIDLARDGRIHPSINPIGGRGKNHFEPGGKQGVRTGRMSCSDPNLQNVPIHTDAAKLIRNCFEGRCDPRTCGCGRDHSYLTSDFDQIELRVLARISEDEALRRAFITAEQTGIDMFTLAARQIFSDPNLIKADERRGHTKNGFYATSYGAKTPRFAKTAGIRTPDGRLDIGRAQAFLDQLHRTYPGMRSLAYRVEAFAQEQKRLTGVPYIMSPLTGRHFEADQGRLYALLNYMIQGVAGEILKYKIVEVDQAGLGEFMVLPVHDELDLDVPTELVRDVKHTLGQIMNDDKILAPVPVSSSMSSAHKWGDCEK